VADYQVDIVIVGAGVIGLSAALALAPTKLNIVVLDAQPSHRPPPTQRALSDWAPRVTALTPASTKFLSELGAWQAIWDGGRVGPYTDMVVWDSEGTGLVEFDAKSLSLDALGYIVEAPITADALVNLANQTANITIEWDTWLAQLDFDDHQATVVTRAGTNIRAQLVIGADGGRSVSRELAGIRTRQWSYGQKAIVATVRVAPGHASACWQAFLPTGPLALLPLSETDLCSIVWSLDDQEAQSWIEADDIAFLKGLNLALGGRGPQVIDVSERQLFPLVQCHAMDYLSDRFVLVGDAAHAIHPLAGQGINLGLSDAKVLAAEVRLAHKRNAKWWTRSVLKRYERQRKGDNLAMMAAMQAFKWGFGSRHPAATMLRNAGLTAVDAMPLAKRWFIKQAVGEG
jgi:2-octaprenylphenol hydroxylase